MASPGRVLSIQSHVVHGYVGNKCAVFPLQLLGFEVDPMNTTDFSNHTFYEGGFYGTAMKESDLAAIFEGLQKNHLLEKYHYVLTGYIGDETYLRRLAGCIKQMKQDNPALKYVCDPVMGDYALSPDGGGKAEPVVYVPPSLLPIYQEEILQLADIILPNQLEAEKLLDMKIANESDVRLAINTLHDRGPSMVVLTSTTLSKDKVVGFASSRHGGSQRCLRMEIPKLDAMFIGTGDLFAALWLAWSHKHPNDIKLVANKVLSTMQAVLQRTLDASRSESDTPSWDQVELRLIASKHDIETPTITLEAQDWL